MITVDTGLVPLPDGVGSDAVVARHDG